MRVTVLQRISLGLLVAIGLAVNDSMPARAATVPPAQLGILSIGGSPTPGGSLNYVFTYSSTTSGTLVVKAQIRGKHWKATFPVFTTTPGAGLSTLQGSTVAVPTSFQGQAVLQIKATLNGKKIGAKAILVTIAPVAPGPVAGLVRTNLYDVGFENNVTLNGSLVPTTGMGSSLSYRWTQSSGKAVALSTNSAPMTVFTTDALTNFVGMSVGIFVNDVDDQGNTNALYIAPEHRFGNVSGVALDNEQASAAIYGFRLLVSDGSITRTGVFTVACSLQTPAHPNIPLGVTAFFKGATNSTSWSLLSKPAASAATLTHTNGLIAQLRPDVEGAYVIRDNVTGQTVTNTAATWTGYQFCAICHGPGNNVGQIDMVTPWSQTLHSTMAQRGVDGVFGSHYSEACFQCHTTGFNQSPAATNGNWYAVQQLVGWVFPTVLQPGNYAAMPTDLQNKANIQCENCHGPGSRHPGSPSISPDEKVCSSCHEDGSHHVHPEQWEVSPHAGAYENISANDGVGMESPCSRCHSPAGFIDEAKRLNAGVPISVINSKTVLFAGPLTCQACHDPHNTYGDPARHQLRVFDTVTVGEPSFTNTIYVDRSDPQAALVGNLAQRTSNVTVTNLGDIAACLICHNARREAMNLNGTKLRYQNSSPHLSPIAESFLGIGCVDYGIEMGNSFHTYLAECTDCHMYSLRGPSGSTPQDSVNVGGVVKPVDAATYAKYSNVLGAHTFRMTYQDGTNEVENIAACNQCHSSFEPVSSFDFKSAASHDYDGNGSVDGIQTEVGTGALADINPTSGLLNMVIWKMTNSGMTVSTNAFGFVDGFGGYSTNAVISEAQHKAAWNVLVLRRDGSRGVHNTQFTIRLLQTTYTDLSTNTGGGTFIQEHPNAYLR